jgi:hypothetical protein
LKTHIPSSAWRETDMAKPAAKSANGTTINTNNILIEAHSSQVNKEPRDRAGSRDNADNQAQGRSIGVDEHSVD